MFVPLKVALAACALLAAVATPAVANPVIELGSFVPTTLNGRQMVGGGMVNPDEDSSDPPKPGVWVNGTLTPLKLPAGVTAGEVSGISASGRISGAIKAVDGNAHAYYWNSVTATGTRIGPFGTEAADYSATGGVTDAGAVVGRAPDATSFSRAFVANDGSIEHSPDDLSAVFGVTPNGNTLLNRRYIGNPGVTGWYLGPTLSSPGPKVDLEPILHAAFVLGGVITEYYAPNLASDGTLLGRKDEDGNSSTPETAWIRLPNGAETQVTGLAGRNAVNARHVVAGTVVADFQGQPILHAAIRKADGTIVDLNTQVPTSQHIILISAMLINDNGDVAGIAVNEAGNQIGFLLPAGYVVDDTGDQPDATVGDGNCLTAAPQPKCTLRAALQEVSAGTSDAPVNVSFNLPGNATTIAPATALPAISKPVAIEGAGNPGGRPVIDGASAGSSAIGLRIQGDNSRVRGISVKSFGGAGIRIQASKTLIGGLPTGSSPCPAPCNRIQGNGGAGVVVAGAGSTANAIRGNRIAINGGPAIDLGEDGRTPNDASDADAGANELHNFPTAVLGTKDPHSGQRSVSGIAAPTDSGKDVDIYAQAAVRPGKGAEPAEYVGTTTIQQSGAWALEVPDELPANELFFSAAIATTLDGTSELSAICGDPDGDGTPDTDGDGLCDDWEIHGLDINDDGNVDLPLNDATYGANPSHKDLYLELDAMQATGPRTYAPQQLTVDSVVKAFADAPVSNPDNFLGVALHVNPGRPTVDETVPERLTIAGEGRSPGSLLNIRDGNLSDPCDGAFGSPADRTAPDCAARIGARAAAFRYVLFAHAYSEFAGSSGIAPVIGGSTLTVTVAQTDAASFAVLGGGISSCRAPDGCRRRVEAATLMHEFGHTLGLRHGGNEDLNYKPNYLSVMNYLYQFQEGTGRPMDYARYELPALDESNLIDADGVLGGLSAATRTEIAGWWPNVTWTNPSGCQPSIAPTGGAVDWDGSPATTTSASVIHADGRCVYGASGSLTGPKDWPNLVYSFRQGEGNPANGATALTPEFSSEFVLSDAARKDFDRNGINDLADSCRIVAGADFADANANGFADICEDDMTKLQAFPSQPGGSGQPGPAGSPGGPAADTTAPTISGLNAKPSTAKRAKGKKKAVPAKLAFSVSEASVVTFTGERAKAGRLSKQRCVAGGKKGKKCTAYKAVKGILRVNGTVGANALAFDAKLGTTKLAAGTYRLTAVAIDAAGNRSAPATVTVTVK